MQGKQGGLTAGTEAAVGALPYADGVGEVSRAA